MDDITRGCPYGTVPYTIKRGDTLYDLSIQYNTTIDIIMSLNPGLDPDNLPVGITICVPTNIGICPGSIHTIQPGDTLYRISKEYGVKVIDIIRVNPYIDVYNLRIGGKLCIPTKRDKCVPEEKVYIVKEGDTLTSILDKLNIGFEMLQEVNEKIDFENLTSGMKICVPEIKGYDASPSGRDYIIERDQNLVNIAKKFGISTDELLKINPKFSPRQFTSGAKICLPVRAKRIY
ncbi:MAG: LysM peptidoglycan-binding domain-containing protein [Eubacteriales bacterium]